MVFTSLFIMRLGITCVLEAQKQFSRTGGGCWVRHGDFDWRFRVSEDGESRTHPTSGSLELTLVVGDLLSTSAPAVQVRGCIWRWFLFDARGDQVVG